MSRVVSPITRKSFIPYASLGKSNSEIEGRICDLLFRLIQTDSPAKVKSLCEAEMSWLNAKYDKASTRTSYVSAYRKAVRAYFTEAGIAKHLAVEKETVKGPVVNHLAESYLLASAEDYAAVNQSNKAKTAIQRDNLRGFDASAVVAATTEALRSSDWREVAVGLLLSVQSRPSDMLSSGDYRALSKYRLEFTSRSKKRGAAVKGEIYCLVETTTFMDAFGRLRREPDVIEMQSWSLKDIDSGKNKTLNRAVRRIYGEIIPVPYGEKELSCKNLRAAGVNVAYWLHGRDNQSLGRFAELQLLHDNPSTSANYEDFYCTDAEGNRLPEIGILADMPLAAPPPREKRSSLSLDRQLLETIADAERWGEGSNAERLERIIAKALQVDKLAAQLARECEKRQRLELTLNRMQSAPAVNQPVVTAAKNKPQRQRPPTKTAKPSDFEWREVPNAELKGDRRNGAYAEKLRRSVEAIQAYNAGLAVAEQFAITGSLLRQLTKVKPEKVKEWMDAHRAELDSYNAGYSPRQNTGKPNLRSAIKWNEAVYGAYEW
jgi:hypothetical protein